MLLIIAVLYSCKSAETVNKEVKAEKSVVLEMYIHRPHCGGAISSFEENGSTTIMANRKFFLDDQLGIRQYVETSQDGKLHLKIAPGSYHLFSLEKELDSASFIRTKSRDNQYYKNAPPECFERWRTTPDLSFIVVNDTIIKHTENTRCFTSNNPCIEYFGPMPP